MPDNTDTVAASSVAENNQSPTAPITVRFKVEKDCIRRVVLKDDGKDIVIYHLYPSLAEWLGRKLPDDVNPRSHDEEALRSSVANNIAKTLKEAPGDFYLANRGATILAQDLRFDPDTGTVDLLVTDSTMQGIADGATTDAVLAMVQRQIQDGSARNEETGELVTMDMLRVGRIHLEVIIGLDSKDRIDAIVLGRNTSRAVKGWSMSDFRGAFNWLHDILDAPTSQFHDKIGYEENAGKSVTVLDVLSLATLFHRQYDEKRKAPTVAYSGKGRMDIRLNDPELQPGYKGLAPILEDILRLHDHVYAGFEEAYKQAQNGRARLGRRSGIEAKQHSLPLTGTQVNHVIPSGLIFPLLASLRALVAYDGEGRAHWKSDPQLFFDRNGAELVATLIEQLELCGGNPNTAGKKRPVYTALHDRARLLLSED